MHHMSELAAEETRRQHHRMSKLLGTMLAVALSTTGIAGCAVPTQTIEPPDNEEDEIMRAAPTPTTCPASSSDEDPFDCSVFVSTGGTAPDADVSWLITAPLVITTTIHDGLTFITLGTPCNAISFEASIASSEITARVDTASTTFKTCNEASAEAEEWAEEFFRYPVAFKLSESRLELRNDRGEILMKALESDSGDPDTTPGSPPPRSALHGGMLHLQSAKRPSDSA